MAYGPGKTNGKIGPLRYIHRTTWFCAQQLSARRLPFVTSTTRWRVDWSRLYSSLSKNTRPVAGLGFILVYCPTPPMKCSTTMSMFSKTGVLKRHRWLTCYQYWDQVKTTGMPISSHYVVIFPLTASKIQDIQLSATSSSDFFNGCNFKVEIHTEIEASLPPVCRH